MRLLCFISPQLVFGNSGVLQGISVGKTYVDMSTVDLETISDVSEVRRLLFQYLFEQIGDS